MDLEASDEQLDCPFVYASAKAGYASLDPEVQGKDMTPLFDTILDYIPAPEGDAEAPTQVLISTIDYNAVSYTHLSNPVGVFSKVSDDRFGTVKWFLAIRNPFLCIAGI